MLTAAMLTPALPAAAADAEAIPATVTELCHLDGIRGQVQCGELAVPENYQQPNGAKINIRFAVLPSLAKGKEDPLVFLAGGPGQSAVDVAGMINTAFRPVRANRDIVLIDQRGTGGSQPLSCFDDEQDVYTAGAWDFDAEDVRQCLSSLSGDLSQYNSENAIRDFEAVREHLGYQQVNLYGGSYGTRAGLVYMRMFPESVRTAVLDSVGPLQVPIGPFGQSAARSFELVLAECRANAGCQQAFPNLENEFAELKAKLKAQPVEVTIPHPTLGHPTTLLVDEMKLVANLRMQLYSTVGRSMVPLVIHEAHKGNFLPLAGLMAQFGGGESMQMSMGLTFNIVCNEDIPRVSTTEMAQDADNSFGGNASHFGWQNVCPLWPQYRLDPSFAEPVKSDIPTLLLSGNFDPVTPPSNGDKALETLSNARHLVVDNGAHTVAFHSCAPKLINQFLDSKQPADLDPACLADVPTTDFMLGLNGSW